MEAILPHTHLTAQLPTPSRERGPGQPWQGQKNLSFFPSPLMNGLLVHINQAESQ